MTTTEEWINQEVHRITETHAAGREQFILRAFGSADAAIEADKLGAFVVIKCAHIDVIGSNITYSWHWRLVTRADYVASPGQPSHFDPDWHAFVSFPSVTPEKRES